MNLDEFEEMAVVLQAINRKLDALNSRLETVENGLAKGKEEGETTRRQFRERDCGKERVTWLGNMEREQRLAQFEALCQEDSYLAYVDSFVSLVNQVELSDEDQVILFVKGLKENETRLIKVLNPKNLQQAIAFGKALTSEEDPHKSTRVFTDGIHVTPEVHSSGMHSLVRKYTEVAEGKAVTYLVSPEGKQKTTLSLPTLPDIGMIEVKQTGCASQQSIAQKVMDVRNVQGVKQTIKTLKEAVVPYRGPERVELLRRWLAMLKDIERNSEEGEGKGEQNRFSVDSRNTPGRSIVVLYYDPVVGGRPMNFQDVFLHSQALESITLSMILEAPNEEEISLLHDMFGICLDGGEEVNNTIVSSIHDLAHAYAGYEDEVLMRREELLHFAQSAINGLKINYVITRIDDGASRLKKGPDKVGVAQKDVNADSTDWTPMEEQKEEFYGHLPSIQIPYVHGTTRKSEVEHVPGAIVALLQLLRFHLRQGQHGIVQMANPSFESRHPGKSEVKLSRVIDWGLRVSRVSDKESLSVNSGKMGWTIRIDLHIVDRVGNLENATKTVALGVLLTFQRTECIGEEKRGQGIIVYPPEAWESIPLIILYLPITATMAIVDDEDIVIINPTHPEESVLREGMTATSNANGDDCDMQKERGVDALQSDKIDYLGMVATKVGDMTSKIKKVANAYNRERALRKFKGQPIYVGSITASKIRYRWAGSSMDEEQRQGEPLVHPKNGWKQIHVGVNLHITKDRDYKVQLIGGNCYKNGINNTLFERLSGWDPDSKGTDAGFFRLSPTLRASSKALKRQKEEQTGRHGYFMLDDRKIGLKALKAITINKLQKAFPELENEVKWQSNCANIYSYAIHYGLTEEEQKSIDIGSSCELLGLVLGNHLLSQMNYLMEYLKAQNVYQIINMGREVILGQQFGSSCFFLCTGKYVHNTLEDKGVIKGGVLMQGLREVLKEGRQSGGSRVKGKEGTRRMNQLKGSIEIVTTGNERSY